MSNNDRNFGCYDRVFPLALLFCIGLFIYMLLYFPRPSGMIFCNNINGHTSSAPKAKDQLHMTNSSSVCHENETLLLERCSRSTFVSSRAKKRITADKNAVFLHGDRVIDLGQNYFVSVDDILFGYDMLFEKDFLFSAGSWLGAQFQASPQDAFIFQQLIWKIKPDLIIDLGTNTGGSALFFASIMSFYTDEGTVLTIDVKPFSGNWVSKDRLLCRDCVNPSDNKLWKKYVQFIQGSTTDPQVIAKVNKYVLNSKTIFVSQDASHACDIVYQDLLNYAPFVSVNSYIVVQDTKLDRITNSATGPLAAVRKFLEQQNKTGNYSNFVFDVDRSVEIFYYSQHAYGWLKRLR
jgi:cephalosporin hydroxylase